MKFNNELPLAFGVSHGSEWIADNLCAMCSSYRDAVRMCWQCRRVRNMTHRSLAELADLTPQHVSDYLALDDNAGRRSLPADKVANFEAACGNRAITQWEMKQRGLTILEQVLAERRCA